MYTRRYTVYKEADVTVIGNEVETVLDPLATVAMEMFGWAAVVAEEDGAVAMAACAAAAACWAPAAWSIFASFFIFCLRCTCKTQAKTKH